MNPEKIGRYTIKSELGRGGMATVYYANDPRFKRDVAIKVLPAQFMHDVTFRARFEREAQTIAALEHPAIVPVYDFGEEDEQPYLVMRYMPGGSLADRMKEGPMPVAETIRIIARLASALDEVHSKGIIHRDLKPANVLFDQYDNAFLSDFGIARLTQATTTLTGDAIIGTPAYMSPEQARGDADIDGRSDIYALGAILFQMLTGKQPYEATTPMGIAMKHLTEPVPSILEVNASLPPDSELIIKKAMAKDKRARYQNGSAMSSDLETLASGRPRQPAGATLYAPLPTDLDIPGTSVPLTDIPSTSPPASVAPPAQPWHPALQPQPRQYPPQTAAQGPAAAPGVSRPVRGPISHPVIKKKIAVPVWVWAVGGLVIVGGLCLMLVLFGAGGTFLSSLKASTKTPSPLAEVPTHTPQEPTEVSTAFVNTTPTTKTKRVVTSFQDDFSNPNSGWSTSQEAGTMVSYENGGFRIFVDRPNWWLTVTPDVMFNSDVTIEVDATKVGGPDENYFGIICRYQDDNNFYMMAIVSLGYYGFVKYKNGEASFMGKDSTLYYSNTIHQGKTSNHLRADCIGDTLTMYANGIILGAVQDSDFTYGDVGLTAIALKLAGTNIIFDNFTAKQP